MIAEILEVLFELIPTFADKNIETSDTRNKKKDSTDNK